MIGAFVREWAHMSPSTKAGVVVIAVAEVAWLSFWAAVVVKVAGR